ncbi:uncharacterized protein LOC103376482 [Stegastes partitus]|uniref:Uncharacterized protein LOC103376482 n=1 Tax=Stegastes partitus TaxID=144197 RepID=A0A9Y4NWY6_9TELE|nr:PREDICTED: uncharacterized protein LOC103376482 [Stegastes partitus]
MNSTDPPETPAVTPEKASSVQVVAEPDYPVAAGQTVTLRCTTVNMLGPTTLFWQHLTNQTWKVVGNGSELTLTEPQQSGQYRCFAERELSWKIWSQNQRVYIVSIQATVGENLGKASFALSLLACVFFMAIIFWLTCKSVGGTTTTTNAMVKGLPGPQIASKAGLPQNDSDGDVYMNYTNSNPGYTDLDPTSVTADNVYSSLS